MRGGDFRGLDLRDLNATGIDFTDAYFRSADLRGLDLRGCSLEGASLAHAQISGAYFPPELTADEILMSVNFGTRLRLSHQITPRTEPRRHPKPAGRYPPTCE